MGGLTPQLVELLADRHSEVRYEAAPNPRARSAARYERRWRRSRLTLAQFANPAYAPASNFIGDYPSLAFSVEGREVPGTVPEPASLMLTGCGLLTLARAAHRRTRRAS